MNVGIALLRREDGQDLIEYALLASLLSIVSILALEVLSSHIRVVWSVLGFVIGGSTT
jgi:Flp pilus assembly pilin Flp